MTAVAYLLLSDWSIVEDSFSGIFTPFLYVHRDPAIKHPSIGVKKGLLGSGLIWYAIWSFSICKRLGEVVSPAGV